jgi:hypothetical protein
MKLWRIEIDLKPDVNGKCPSGFNLNVDSQCIPNKCPKHFVRHDNDETGTCYPRHKHTQFGRVQKLVSSNILKQPIKRPYLFSSRS